MYIFDSDMRSYHVILLIIFLSLSTICTGQQKKTGDEPNGNIYSQRYRTAPQFGISLGINSSDINDNFFGTSRKIGFYGGIKIEYFFLRNVFIHSTIAYSQKGSVVPFRLINSQGGLTEEEFEDKLRLSYLDLPIMISRQFSLNKRNVRAIKIYPMLGIDQGILIRAINKVPRLNQQDEVIFNTFNLLTVEDPKFIRTPVTMHRYNFGITGGFGAKISMPSNYTLFIEGRYAHFLSPFIATNTSHKFYFYNNSFTINTGMLF